MSRLWMLLCAGMLLLVPPASAQRLTEQFIPIGESPGASGRQTVIGKVTSVETGARMLVVDTGTAAVRVALTDRTRIWLDASRAKQPTRRGAIGDLQPGRRVEFLHEDQATRTRAEWVKVDVIP